MSDRGEFLVVMLLSFGYFTGSAVVMLLRGVRRVDLTTERVLAGLVFELVTLAAVAIFLHVRGWKPADLGLRFSWLAALGGISLCLLYLTLYSLIVIGVMFIGPVQGLQLEVVRTAPVPLLLLFIIVNSFFEEVTVTGYVIESLSKQGAALAVTASTLIRLGYHVYQGPVATLSILPMGLLFGAVYWRWRTLWPLIVAHTMVNAMAVLR